MPVGRWSTARRAAIAQPTHCGDGAGSRLRSRGGSGHRMDVRWSRRRDSNPEPAVYKTAALPIELRRRDGQGHTAEDPIRRRGMIWPRRPDGSSVAIRLGSSLGTPRSRACVPAAGLRRGGASGGSRSSSAGSGPGSGTGVGDRSASPLGAARRRGGRSRRCASATLAGLRGLERAALAAFAVVAASRRSPPGASRRRLGLAAFGAFAGRRRPRPRRRLPRLGALAGLAPPWRPGRLGGASSARRSARSAPRRPRRRRRASAPASSTTIRPHPPASGCRHAVCAVPVVDAGSRWATASNSRIEPATAALSEPTWPRIGIRMNRSQRRRMTGPRPWPSLPTTMASGPRRSLCRAVRGASPSAPATRTPRRVEVAQRAREVVDRAQQQVLDRAGGGLHRRRAQRRLAMGRDTARRGRRRPRRCAAASRRCADPRANPGRG